MNDQAAQRAIKAALKGNWDEAIEFNLQTLKQQPTDTDTLNRLARAYAAIGQTKNAQKIWNKVLHIDPYNSIALQLLAKVKHSNPSPNHPITLTATTFLDEPGKTKTVPLTKLANPKLLLGLETGQLLELTLRKRSITISTNAGEYIGILPDDLSLHLHKLIQAGNKYETRIRRVSKNSVHVFLKETKKAKRYQHTPSFTAHTPTPTLELETFSPIYEAPIDIAPTGEDSDQ